MPLFPVGSESLPPYAVNVFIPLQDADGSVESGPTEFIAESHRMDEETAMQAVEATTSKTESSIVSPVLKRGDILIYDYRTCHRGTSNLSNALNKQGRVRSILYLMYSRPWFKEHMNFGTETLFAE
jgi:ectoine hydroxylase-related dioxygenase (phytanoyl-CoA dioxygenase family)